MTSRRSTASSWWPRAVVSAALSGCLHTAWPPRVEPAQQPKRPLVTRFDTDGDGRLNRAERQEARAFLAAQAPRAPLPGESDRRLPAEPGPGLRPSDVRRYSFSDFYDPRTLRTIFLQFENPDWEDELAAFYGTDVEVPAQVMVDGRSYRDVGVHFRGNSSYLQVPKGRKHSLALTVDFVHSGQDLLGYRSLHLLNAHEDPTFLRVVLFAAIARRYVPAPKANFVRVVVNGESWGVYVNVQAFNKDFLRDNFQTARGARWTVAGMHGRGGLRYLGEKVEEYRAIYEIKSKDDPQAWADLITLCRVLDQTPPSRLEAALRPILDVDGALRLLALDNALINNDGTWTRAADFNLYQDKGKRFHILPRDFNESLRLIEDGVAPVGREGARVGTVELDPLIGLDDDLRPLRAKLLAVPALRRRYLAYVRDIASRWLNWSRLGPMARRYQALIAEDVRSDTRKLYPFEPFDARGAGGLRQFAERRRAFLLGFTPPG